jgi:hypothetical protein
VTEEVAGQQKKYFRVYLAMHIHWDVLAPCPELDLLAWEIVSN